MRNVEDLKLYHKNPRKITDDQFRQLSISLQELGDLSGIVVNRRTGEIIGGNQRSTFFKENRDRVEIQITEEFETPTPQGTLAYGYVLFQGEKFAYREVDWDEKQSEKANIVANKAGGVFDFDILANQFNVEDLLGWGFRPIELGIGDSGKQVSFDVKKSFEVVIEAHNEEEQQRIFDELTKLDYKCKVLSV